MPADQPSRAELETLLRLYADSGLDFALEPEPVDRFADPAPRDAPAAQARSEDQSGPPAQAAPDRAAPRPARVPDEEAVAMARKAALEAPDLDALRRTVETFEACNLRQSARHTVFEGGRRGAALMVIGAAPSREDDRSGEAFSGPDGALLGNMLAAIGLDRQNEVYAGFCVPWAVPGGEQPTALHLAICAPLLHRQITLAAPRIIVALGNVAARQLTGSQQTILKLRGTWSEADFGAGPVAVTALFEPAFLRDEPRFKRMAWLDLLALKKRLTPAG